MDLKQNKKEDPFDEPWLKDWHLEMVIDSWHQMLEGIDFPSPRKETFYCHSNIEELEKYISAFELKYKRKLKYRIDCLSYISYEETILDK